MYSIDGEGDRDVHDMGSAKEGTSEEKERNRQSGQTLSILMSGGWRREKWMKMTQKPGTPIRREETIVVERRGF